LHTGVVNQPGFFRSFAPHGEVTWPVRAVGHADLTPIQTSLMGAGIDIEQNLITLRANTVRFLPNTGNTPKIWIEPADGSLQAFDVNLTGRINADSGRVGVLNVESNGDVSIKDASANTNVRFQNRNLPDRITITDTRPTIPRVMIGLDGISIYHRAAARANDRLFYYSALSGLTVTGQVNMPGVLFSGSINANGTVATRWGAYMLAVFRTGTGQYSIGHLLQHASYMVVITCRNAQRIANITSKNHTAFNIEIVTTGNNRADTDFDFAVFGSNSMHNI